MLAQSPGDWQNATCDSEGNVDDSVDGECVSVTGGASAVRPQCDAPPSHTSPSSPLHTTTSTICKYNSRALKYMQFSQFTKLLIISTSINLVVLVVKIKLNFNNCE